MKAKIVAVFLLAIFLVAGCISEYETDNDEGKGVITDGSGLDKKKEYQVISSHLQKMTAEAWTVSGSAYELRRDENLSDCTGEYTRQTGDQVEFEGRIVIPVRERINLTFEDNLDSEDGSGDPTVITRDTTRFYTEEGVLLAEADTASGQITSRISSDEIDSGGWPESCRTGEFGFLVEMTMTSGIKRSSVWYLEKTTEGNANFIIKSADRKESEEAEIVEERTETINTAGDIVLRKIKMNDLEKRYRIEIDLIKAQ